MAAVGTSTLLIGLLVSFCNESFQAGGWTEEPHPNTPAYRAIAQYAYMSKKPRSTNFQGLTYHVTQARWKVVEGVMYNLGFIVFRGNTMIEKCISVVSVPPPDRPRRRGVIAKFWCR